MFLYNFDILILKYILKNIFLSQIKKQTTKICTEEILIMWG
jgi:hypothetical protein